MAERGRTATQALVEWTAPFKVVQAQVQMTQRMFTELMRMQMSFARQLLGLAAGLAPSGQGGRRSATRKRS